eukprot:5981202-Amphidinium_carterae.1
MLRWYQLYFLSAGVTVSSDVRGRCLAGPTFSVSECTLRFASVVHLAEFLYSAILRLQAELAENRDYQEFKRDRKEVLREEDLQDRDTVPT